MLVAEKVKCGKCLQYAYSQPFLLEACASVGIEHGKSSGQMIVDYLDYYHKSRHREL